jgi:hypothetical protein
MDKLTDILTTFFVTSKKEIPKQQEHKKSPVKSESHHTSSHSSHHSPSSSSHSSQHSSSSSSHSSHQSSSSHSSHHSPSSSSHSSHHSPSDHLSKEKSEKPTDIGNYELSSIEQEPNQEVVEAIENNKELNAVEAEEVKEFEENGNSIAKYTLKPNEFCKKSIFIVNDNLKDSIDILSDLLYKLGLKKDIDTLYNNKIHIISSIDNKKLYRQMLLENPYLYFTDFDVKSSLQKRKLNDLDDTKRHIFIFDIDTANEYTDSIVELSKRNIHLFVLAKDEDKLIHALYSSLGSNKLMICKPTKLKMIHKKFYKNYIKHICDNEQDFDQYYNKINNENIDKKYIIIKDNQLRYN